MTSIKFTQNRRIRGVSASMLLLVVFFLFACESEPKDETEATRQSIETAKQADAAQLAPQPLMIAMSKFDSAQQEISTQGKQFLKKDYSEAKRLLKEAANSARVASALALKTTLAASDAAQAAVEEAAAATKAAVLQATKDDAEAAINQVYIKWKDLSKKVKDSKSRARLDSAMVDLKKAQKAMKEAIYTKAVNSAKQADSTLQAIQAIGH